MPTSKQRREAARRHLERQLVRRQQRDARRRQLTLIATVVGTLVVLAVAITAVVMLTNDNKKSTAASSTSSSSASASPSASASGAIAAKKAPAKATRAAKKTSGPCAYQETAQDLSNPNTFDVGLPPDAANTPATGTQTVKMVTTRGEIDLQLNRADAPCAVQSWDFLIGKKFYDNTPCHRLVNQGIYVLQCGDPTGSGSGGATYRYKEENTAKAKYGEGVVAMAKQQTPGSTGSQFFIIYQDSSSGLAKDYSVVGKVTKGLDIVKQVAAGGLAADGTAPALPIGIKSATIAGSLG